MDPNTESLATVVSKPPLGLGYRKMPVVLTLSYSLSGVRTFPLREPSGPELNHPTERPVWQETYSQRGFESRQQPCE